MKVGIYGGTFDPPHNGHVYACAKFLEKFDLDKLYIVPTSVPPHKVKESDVDGYDRMEMSKLAFSHLSDKIEFSDVELKRSGKSYTSDTIRHFKSLGYNDIYLLCGTDMFTTFDTWNEFIYIFENVTVVCIRRENDDELRTLIDKKRREYQKLYNANLEFLNDDALEASSTYIRKTLLSGGDASEILPKDVYDYILKRGLYKNGKF